MAYGSRIVRGRLTKSIALFLAATVLLGMAVAGCGGDGDDSAAATDGKKKSFEVQASTTVSPDRSLSKTTFIAQVDRYCRQAWKEILRNYKEYSRTLDTKLSQRQRTAQAIRLSLMAGIDFHIFDNVHFLGAPKGEEVEVEEIIGAMQEAVERGQRLDPLYSVAEVTALFSDYNQRAALYGLDGDCLVNATNVKI
jgi:hypothetical protein